MSDEVKSWRYALPSEKGEGWAIVHMDSRGFFATCSDYGNYAYHWSSFGEDFRSFMLHMERDYDYFGNKLDHDKWHSFSLEQTVKHIKQRILERRREGRFDKDEALEEWECVRDLDDGNISWEEWVKSQKLYEDWSAAADLACHEPRGDILAFCKKTLPRLCKILKAELEAEAHPGVESEPQTVAAAT
jgi:hypothetical protein